MPSPLAPWSNIPPPSFDPVAFERNYDNQARAENAGAEDSESDGDDDDEHPAGADREDRMLSDW